MNKINLFVLAGIFLFFLSCVEELEFDRPSSAEFIVVDGILNYNPLADSSDLIVYLNLSNTNSSRPVPLSGALMEVSVNDEISYPLQEGEDGVYYLTNPEIFTPGSSYRLLFQIADKIYESTPEILPDSVQLDNVYAELNTAKTAIEAYEVFVDMNDPSDQKNYYRWLITQWEKKKYCQFCYREQRNPEVCQSSLHAPADVNLSRNNLCEGECFEIFKFSPNNSLSDVFIDGKSLIRKSVGFAAFHFSEPCLIEVKQSSLTSGYFSFLEKLRAQAEATGGLADTPAALLSANISNVNDSSEKVVGYFSVTNNTVRRFWLERKDALNFYTPIGRINPPLDPPVPTPPDWRPLPCESNENSTPIKPRGWRD